MLGLIVPLSFISPPAMSRPQAQRPPRKHFSTMPRIRSEANTYLDLYKLQLEKQRLNCKLQGMEQQTLQIQQRLAQIETEMGAIQADINPANPLPPASESLPPAAYPRSTPFRPGPSSTLPQTPDTPSNFKTLFVEY